MTNEQAREVLAFIEAYTNTDNWAMSGVFLPEHPTVTDATHQALKAIASAPPAPFQVGGSILKDLADSGIFAGMGCYATNLWCASMALPGHRQPVDCSGYWTQDACEAKLVKMALEYYPLSAFSLNAIKDKTR